MHKYFERVGNDISSWESKQLSNEKNSSTTTTSNKKFATNLVDDNARIKLKFNGDFLKQDQVTYNHGPIVNIFIVCRLTSDTEDSSITLEDCLFGPFKLTKNGDIDKYKYSGYGIGLYSRGSFSHSSGGDGRNVIIFGADMSSSAHANNKSGSILVLGKDFIQGIDNTTIYAEKMYSTSFTVDNKKICLSLHYNGDNGYLFVSGKEIINFKAKDSEIVPYPLCLASLSKDFSVGNMRATGFTGVNKCSRSCNSINDPYAKLCVPDVLKT